MDERPRLLFTGMTANPGGKESFILSAFAALKDDFDCWFLADRPQLAHQEKIERMGGRIVFIRPRSKAPVGNRRDLRDLFDEVSFDVVWSHQTVLNTIAPLGFAKRADVPVRIIHSHSTQNMGTWVAATAHPVNRRLLGFVANRRFACSDVAARWFYGTGRYQLIPNIFDVERFTFDPAARRRARQTLSLGADTTVLIHAARFGVEKNHELDLAILSEMLGRGRDVVLLLVGDGERRAEIEGLVQRDALGEHVRFLGVREDIPQLLQAADLMLLPSRFEGLPYTILEAQAAGLACLVSDRVSPDCAVGGKVRFEALESPPSAWADAIDELIDASERHPGVNPLRGTQYDATSSRARLLAAMRVPRSVS